MIRPPPRSPLFPHTPLFRPPHAAAGAGSHPPSAAVPPRRRGRRRTVPSCARPPRHGRTRARSEEHTSELQSRLHLVCRLLLEKKKNKQTNRVNSRLELLDSL